MIYLYHASSEYPNGFPPSSHAFLSVSIKKETTYFYCILSGAGKSSITSRGLSDGSSPRPGWPFAISFTIHGLFRNKRILFCIYRLMIMQCQTSCKVGEGLAFMYKCLLPLCTSRKTTTRREHVRRVTYKGPADRDNNDFLFKHASLQSIMP